MVSTTFAALARQAAAGADAVMAEPFAVRPMVSAADVNAAPVDDVSRSAATVMGILLDPEAKPTLPNSYDPRQVRRPGVESGHPRILISPAALAALSGGFGFQRPDQLTQVSTGRAYAVSTVFAMAGGSLKLSVNLVG